MTQTNTTAVEVTAIPDFWDQVHQAEHLFLGLDYDGTLWVMNPGAAGDYTRPTCGLLTIREGAVTCSVQSISLGR